MEDDVLHQILAVQTEILAELRQLRQAVAAGVTVRPVAARPAAASQPAAPAQASATTPAQAPPSAPQAQAPAPQTQAAPSQAQVAQPQPQAQVAPAEAAQPQAQGATPQPAPEPEPEFVEAPPPPRRAGSGMMTMDELAELGGQFLEGVARPKARTRPTDVADLGGSLLDEIKAKNRAKRDAFAEFDRLRRDR